MSIFNTLPKPKLQRATFDLSHTRKLSMKMGELVPVLVQEVVPGDKFNISTESMIRLAPLVSPVMHRMNSTIHYFFVPNRIIWEEWEEFITGQENLVAPYELLKKPDIGKLADHMGLPTHTDFTAAGLQINTLPFRAYFKIWNDYYRDGELQEEFDFESEELLSQPLKVRAWEKDYFTSALTSPQKGAAVKMDGKVNYLDATKIDYSYNPGHLPGNASVRSLSTPYPDGTVGVDVGGQSPLGAQIQNIESVSIDVEELRLATRLQRFLERSARSGTRYAEHLLAHWGIKTKDSRLQRAEYLGGGRTPIVISEVPNTTGTTEAPQGTLAGNGLSIGKSNQASKFVEEHGFIIAIMSVLPESGYYQGVPRMYDRKLNLDFYYPEFAQLGEQEVKNQEIFAGINMGLNEGTFGYQSRYAEYKYQPSTVHGYFRSSLKFWHMARNFNALPLLNEEFITADAVDDTQTNPWRIFAVADAEQLYCQLYHQITATRPMPFLNDPTL